MKSISDAPDATNDPTTDVKTWLNTPFDLNQYNSPLAGFIPLEGCTNLEVLARLISLNGGPKVEGWGRVCYDRKATYNFRGLTNADEAMLLNAMLNFGAGMLAAMEVSSDTLFEFINAQIAIDGGKVVKH